MERDDGRQFADYAGVKYSTLMNWLEDGCSSLEKIYQEIWVEATNTPCENNFLFQEVRRAIFLVAITVGIWMVLENYPASATESPDGPPTAVEAAKLYRDGADRGDAVEQCKLGYAYVHGEGVTKDPVEAIKWYRKSAAQGCARAQCNLGWAYNKGVGVEKDGAQALACYRESAAQGNAIAQCNLGSMYYTGQEVAIDVAEAAKWYRKSAEQGCAVAQYNLGVMYESGEGVSQDFGEAANWYRNAAQHGDAEAADALNQLLSRNRD